MKVNYVLLYGTPYLKYRVFETFEDISKFLVNKSIVNYSIFKKLEDKEEVEMIYRDNDIKYLESIIKEVRELVENGTDFKSIYFKKDNEDLWKVILSNEIKEKYLEILDKGKE